MGKQPSKRQAPGPGYRAQIRELATIGTPEAEILKAIPGLRPSELRLTLSLPTQRGRPPKEPTIRSLEDVQRWRCTKRPRTIRAAVECIDYLLGFVEEKQHQETSARSARRGRTLPGFT
jgi:hypothetical protein